MPADGRTPILYLAPWVDLGGSDRATIDWFKHIDRERWAPSLITTQPSPNRWLHQVEPFAEELWELPDLMPGAKFPEFILGFLESRGIEVLHIMNSRLGFDLLPDIACLPNPPAVVVQLHAEEPNQAGYVRYVTRRYGNLIDAFSVVSEDLKQTIVDYDVPPSRIEVIYLGVDGEHEFDPEQVEPLELDRNGVSRILWPGRLVEQKDPMLTLDVLVCAKQRGGEFVLDIVGDGRMKEALRERADQLGVADLIRWHPPSQEMARWYRSSDLLLMTSLYEGIPCVIYESLAMSVPVVAPALPGNVEFMDADSGVLIEPRDDADRYAEAIVSLLADGKRRREMGERSRRRMLAEFSLAEMGRRHDELYKRLLDRRGAGPTADAARSDAVGSAAPVTGVSTPLTLPRNPSPERSVGVIVPCYRHGIFIDECIESIKAQTLSPTQIVVVDDGSDDPETIAAIDRLEGDPELTVLRLSSNSGPSAARNLALRAVEASYVLPIDADDKLLPDALEQMVARLEAAPADVGFVYPQAQHFGNRSDRMRVPAYNLWLLMEENYIAAPCLFDRRLFGAEGVEYPEEIVLGHEDWDLLLRLAERGVRGLHAEGPTFLYRQQGFSRINAAEYGPHSFDETIERRHPALYGNRDAIKARWSPALSIVLLDDGEGDWDDADLAGLSRQTCGDFELVRRDDLQEALHEARGRWVCLLTRRTAAILDGPAFVEQLLYSFVAHDGVAAVVIGRSPQITRQAFSQLDDAERLDAEPLGIAFERPWSSAWPKIGLGGDNPLLVDLAIELQAHGAVQWRSAPAKTGSGRGRGSRDGAGAPRDSAQIDLNHDRSGDPSEVALRDAVGAQRPRLPELAAGTVRRWDRSEPWTPPLTQLLFRHVAEDGESRFVSNERESPPGYELEFVLGAVHLSAAPGNRRLVEVDLEFELTDEENALPAGSRGLGYVEQQSLPMFELLELRRVPGTGQQTLVAGPDDPLNEVAEPLAVLGWLEACPIMPRRDLLHTGPWGVVALWRQVDPSGSRHLYLAGPPRGRERAGVALGFLYDRPGDGCVALRRRKDGRMLSELARPGRASRDPRRIGRWILGPLREDSSGGSGAAMRQVGSRMRRLAAGPRTRRLSGDEGEALGWLRREGLPGWSPLLSATHPVTGDQLLTTVEHEPARAGYLIDGMLGYVLDPIAGRQT
jgi:glycosyltransferase involved in cell wall biosynthesis